MKTFKSYIDDEFENFLIKNGLILDEIDNNHFAIYNSDFCIKIYDRIGHGYGVNINIARDYNDTIYDNDECNIFWAMKYFNLTASFDFSSRKPDDYESNLPLLISDLKILIEKLIDSRLVFWTKGIQWINKQTQ